MADRAEATGGGHQAADRRSGALMLLPEAGFHSRAGPAVPPENTVIIQDVGRNYFLK